MSKKKTKKKGLDLTGKKLKNDEFAKKTKIAKFILKNSNQNNRNQI
jgi:hypothetical protein